MSAAEGAPERVRRPSDTGAGATAGKSTATAGQSADPFGDSAATAGQSADVGQSAATAGVDGGAGAERRGADFLRLPPRGGKPRQQGLTHVIDRGLSIAEVDGLIETVGEYVDIVKLGWGTALVSANLKPKLERYAAHGIPVVLGGTLTEIAIRQGRVEGLVAWVKELGLGHVEVSDGTIAIDSDVKAHLIRTLASHFTVLSEVGSKDVDFIMAPYVWVEQIERDLQAGAWKVIAEARETGTAGIYRADGEVRTGLIDEIVHAIDAERLIFEAPRREQQVWLLKQLGNECNLGNIAPDDVLSLETLRLGLRSDTVESFGAGGTQSDEAPR